VVLEQELVREDSWIRDVHADRLPERGITVEDKSYRVREAEEKPGRQKVK